MIEIHTMLKHCTMKDRSKTIKVRYFRSLKIYVLDKKFKMLKLFNHMLLNVFIKYFLKYFL